MQWVVGVSGGLGHDASVALVGDGHVYAAQEERFTGRKHEYSAPLRALNSCLRDAGISASDVSQCIFAHKPNRKNLFQEESLGDHSPHFRNIFEIPFLDAVAHALPSAEVGYCWHHLAHALSVYYTTELENAAFLCVDGMGEDSCASIGILTPTDAIIQEELPFPNGIGMLYSMVSILAGFDAVGDEYKLMGLAPYGSPRYLGRLSDVLAHGKAGAAQIIKPVTWNSGHLLQGIEWLSHAIGIPLRRAGEALAKDYVDLACSMQCLFEQQVLEMAKFTQLATGMPNLILTGGCAENSVVVGVVCGRGRNPTLRLWPAIFSGEIDVFPSERRNMGQEIGR